MDAEKKEIPGAEAIEIEEWGNEIASVEEVGLDVVVGTVTD